MKKILSKRIQNELQKVNRNFITKTIKNECEIKFDNYLKKYAIIIII